MLSHDKECSSWTTCTVSSTSKNMDEERGGGIENLTHALAERVRCRQRC